MVIFSASTLLFPNFSRRKKQNRPNKIRFQVYKKKKKRLRKKGNKVRKEDAKGETRKRKGIHHLSEAKYGLRGEWRRERRRGDMIRDRQP